MNNKKIKILKLGEYTFKQWFKAIKDALLSVDLLKYIQEFDYDIRAESDDFSHKELIDLADVRSIIRNALSSEDYEYIIDIENPKQQIAELERKYNGPGAKSSYELLVEFEQLKFDGTISEIFTKARRLYNDLADKGVKLPRNFINCKIRTILPPEFETAGTMLDVYNGGRPEQEHMTDMAFEAELLKIERVVNRAFVFSSSSNQPTSNKHSNSSVSSSSKSSSSKSNNYNQRKCFTCGMPGHISAFCRQRNKYNNRFGNNNNYNNNNNHNNDNNKNKKFNKSSKSSKSFDDVTNLCAVIMNKSSKIICASSSSSSASSVNMSTSSSSSSSTIKFLADGGASFHVVNNRSWLSNIRKSTTSIRTLSGRISFPEIGDLKCKIFNGQRWKTITINDVLFVKDQPFNLIAIGKICKRDGFWEKTNVNGMTIYCNDFPVLVGHWSRDYLNLIELMITVDDDTPNNVVAVAANSLSLWHERFAHFSSSTINKMAMNNHVDGMPIKLYNDIDYCTACKNGKMTDVQHPLTRVNDNIKPGMKIHIDIGGYMKPSLNGSRYFLLAVDQCSRYMKVVFMNHRHQTLNAIKRIINEIKLETGQDVLSVRSDLGTEFQSRSLSSFFNERGIIHETATVATPQQNGLCERAMRTLKEHAASMLHATNLPRTLWDEAINSAAYIYNRVLNSSNIVPYVVYHGHKPNVSNIRIFGSGGEALLKNRSNMDSKTKFVRMVGYNGQSIYRVYVPDERRVAYVSSVSFNEKPKCKSRSTLELARSDRYVADDDDQNNIDADNDDDDVDDKYHDADYHKNDDDDNDDSSDDDGTTFTIYDQQPGSSRGRGRPVGSKNRQHFRNDERVQSLRKRPTSAVLLSSFEPTSYDQAINCEDSDKWLQAMKHEYDQLIKYDTWDLVDRPTHDNIVSVRWIYTIKDDGRYKARLVARGFQQDTIGIDVYAPVVCMESVRLFFSLVASYNMNLIQFDCSNAFLNGDIKDTVYIDQPRGFEDGTNRVCLLKKGLYGLRQSPRCWNEKFDHCVKQYGFNTSTYDPCFYFINDFNEFTILCIYVDDALVASTVNGRVDEIINYISSNFSIRIVDSNKFLGLQYHHDRQNNKLLLHQHDYLVNKLKLFNMNESKPTNTPIVPGCDSNQSSTPNKSYPYRQAIGALLYLSTRTRPDIAFSVSVLARYANDPTEIHVKMLKHLFRYLNGTRNYALTFNGDTNKIIGYSDSDLGGDKTNGRTTTGWIIMFGGPIIWKSKTRKLIIDNTSEAEFISASCCIKDIVFIRNFLNELNIKINNNILFCDNQSSIHQLLSESVSPRIRHIKLKFLLSRSYIEKYNILVKYINTNNQLADVLTKPVSFKIIDIFNQQIIINMDRNQGEY